MAKADENKIEEIESLSGHEPVDDGYCSCGALCETGTGFARHLQRVMERGEVKSGKS